MVKKRVIPCLDVAGGRVVKGVNFVDLREMGEPIELATRYSELGADELVFLDITATLEGRGPDSRPDRACRCRADDSLHRRRGRHRPRRCALASAGRGGQGRREPGCVRRSLDPHRTRRRVRLAGGRVRDRCSWRRGGHARRSNAPRPQRGRLGPRGRRARCRRAARHLDRCRRDARRVRLAADGAVATAVEVPVIASGVPAKPRHLGAAFGVGAEAAIVASIVHERPERLPELKAELREAGWNVRI